MFTLVCAFNIILLCSIEQKIDVFTTTMIIISVHIRRKEVIVYPDDDNKPEQGDGLNRKAEITLDNVWPIDRTNRKPIQVIITI